MAHSYSQKILWTALPRGHYEDGSLRLVVFVSPQLTTDDPRATLADFPDLLHWPTVLAGIDFEVRLGDVTLDPQSITVASAPAVRPEYWEALFGPTMVVRSFTPPPGSLGLAAVASYPAGDIVDFAKQLYSGYLGGDGATDLPAVHDLLERLAPVSFADVPASTPGGPPRPSGADRRRRLLEALSAEYSQGRYVGSGPPPDPGEVSGLAFVQHQEFHKSFTPNVTDPRRLKDPERDFHDYVSALGHYRDLVRLLGLAVDLKIAAPGATAAPFPVGPTTVRVTPKRPPVPMGQSGPPVTATAVVRRDLRPTTRAMLSAGQFLARPRAVKPLLVGGRLPFSDTGRYRAIEIDHDGAAFKLNQMGENLQRARDLRQAGTHAAAGPPSPQGLPVLRARGISVALTGRRGDGDKPPAAGELVTQIDRGLVLSEAVASNDETALLFDAEDVTRGYRVDVWDDHTKRWNSLSAREGTFAVARVSGVASDPVAFADQAIHQLAPTSAPGDAPSTASKALHLQQTLFHWTGWSLGAHRPGKALVPRYRGPGPAPAADPALSAFDFSDPRPPSDFPLQIASHAKPGSLPRLRFGFSYYVRARAADLAGDSVEFGDPHMKPGEQPFKDCLPTPELFYARFDPVSSPPLVFREPATEGASIARLVLRSNYDEPPQAPPADPATAIDERHVVPPKSSMLMIEQHGRLDSTATPPVDPGVYSLLAQRDGARLPGQPGASDDPDARDTGVPEPAAHVAVGYLPDVLARGVAFAGLPGATGVVTVSFDAAESWSDPKPFRLTLLPGSGPPRPLLDDRYGRRIEVRLDKAEVATVRMSCCLLPEDVADDSTVLGLWRWLTAEQRAKLRRSALEGQLWMLTPYREITLVHAVRQPLQTPEFDTWEYDRGVGDTFVRLRRRIRFSRKSTGRVDLHASWPNPVDDGPGSGWPSLPAHQPLPTGPGIPAGAGTTPVAGRRMTLPMDGGDAASFLDVDTTQELGDTKHKAVTYVAEATTRFAEYFTHRTTVTVVHGADHAVVLAAAGVAPKVRVRSLDPADRRTWSDSGKRPSWTVDAAAGKVSFHAYPSVADGAPDPTIPAGTQVEVAFVALPLSRLSVTPVALDIRASSRPAAPDVALLVPTFAWTQTRTPRDTHAPTAQITSRRDAATLRVYLRRPWWTSGAGEQLAIVLYPGGVDGDSSEVPDALVPYVTQWGADPAYAAAPPPAPLPSFAAFPQAVSTHRGLFLDELPQSGATPDSKVDVAVHEVSYDESQDLWYCDVRVDAGHAYQPFVRLALARFQPHALSVQESGIKRDDLHLSRVVIADFVQLAPERVATVTWTPTGTRVTVQLAGPTYKATASEQRPAPMPAVGGPGPGYATVAIESRLPGVSDTDVGWSPVGTPRSMRVTPDASWITEFDLPGAPGGTGQFRLVIEQGDLFAHDPGNSPPGPVSSGTLDSGGRLVHSDVIVL